ncbi:PEP-CTERM sorting domain-containing protein [Chamaesiphon sp. VAR_48_metabat_403]|uniref:PEP-CTERM sorting domain-containing protein n=1 Tax=Chamaesiphon sp. VAR_48_metabat_403 TaxID=2964700 RepID=UPI00286E318D|nr:PEP-CTERM sorting domain-containing protein [Chamaesiphon sp. VAR_48_metabat_403]
MLGWGVIGVNPAQAITFGTNIIVNPGAEAGAGSATGDVVSVPGWTTTGNFTVVPYGAAGFPERNSDAIVAGIGLSSLGNNFFAGGPNNNVSSASQTIDLSSIAEVIDSPSGVGFVLSATFGHFPEKDYPSLEIDYFDANGQPIFFGLLTGKIGPTIDQRGNIGVGSNKFSLFSGFRPGTRSAIVTLRMTRDTVGSSYNNAYADNLSLVLTDRTPATAVPEPSAVPGILVGGALVVGVMKKRRQKL